MCDLSPVVGNLSMHVMNDSFGDILIDHGKVCSNSKGAQQKTTKAHFNKFLRMLNKQQPDKFVFTNIEDITLAELKNQDRGTMYLGGYSSYLLEHCGKIQKFNTHDSYISGIHVILTNKFPELHMLWSAYYTDLRKNVHRYYQQVSVCDGVAMVKHAEVMQRKDRDIICEILFKADDNKGRAILALDWQGAGRISEVKLCYFAELTRQINNFYTIDTSISMEAPVILS